MADAQPAGLAAALAAGPLSLEWGTVAGLAVLCAAVLAVCWLRPTWPLRVALWLATHSVYRLRVTGRDRVPAAGPALLVCNHASLVDWLLLQAALRRPVRFLLFADWARHPVLRRLATWLGAIRVDASADGAALEAALGRAGEELARGELVCVFAEGLRTRSGVELPFHRCYEAVAARHAAPVVPVWLDQPWGSLFEPAGGLLSFRRPPKVPHPVGLVFGAPLPPEARAGDACQAVQKLSADWAVACVPRRRPVHRGFVRMAARHPFRSCFIDSSAPGRDLTYARAFAGAFCFRKLLRPVLGDAAMVAVWLPPSTGGALCNITLALLGKTSVNLNYTSSAEGIRSCLKQCGCRHVLTSKRFTARLPLDPGPDVEVLYLEDFVPRVTKWDRLSGFLAAVLLPGWVLEHWVLGLGGHGPDGLATIIFSSGSTGEPKGVMLTHANVAANVESMVQAINLRPADRLLGVLPFFHSFGYTVTLWAALQVGASAVYHADPRQAREIGELCRDHRCTIYVSTATFLRFCLKKCEPGDFATLRILVCGAEKLPPSLAEGFRERFGVLPLEGYGCTELSPAAAANVPDVESDGFLRFHNKSGTIGQPLPGVAARVVHPDTLGPLPVGVEGLLLAYGANVMKGYLHRPEQTAEVVRDGWYVTGDMARLDDDGFVTLTGRLSRFAKCGGEMVPLEKVEEELHDVLGTSERVCAVTCVPDESRGERVVVLYVAENGLDVRSWCRGLGARGLPNLWVPAERDFFRVGELPVLGSGKLNLKRVKEMALELAGKK
jgi:acyl-[acyl-carrier-protein]-phospholipid O-acyltransferase/long-chain-fatty-acid--[acyl-carrier-protein] ligase